MNQTNFLRNSTMSNIDLTTIKITGGVPLRGTVNIHGAKNAALPAIASSILVTNGETLIKNVPHIRDVIIALEIAEALGASVTYSLSDKTVLINAENVTSTIIPSELAEKSRAGVLFMGALLGRFGKVSLPPAGGCKIGVRKLDFHFRGFARLGAQIVEHLDGSVEISSPTKLKGSYLYLDMPSHTGTENLLMAAVLTTGVTIIDNAAAEPEVTNFAKFLNRMGAKIKGIGTSKLQIEGVKSLVGKEHSLIPDRNVASAYAMAIAASKGTAVIKGFIYEHQRINVAKMRQMGVEINLINEETVEIVAPNTVNPVNVVSMPFPGFATDSQPCITALSTLAIGKSYIRENIFNSRFAFIDELNKLGAHIILSRNNAVIVEGGHPLSGTTVQAPDLRGGFALIIAGLAAKGVTTITQFDQVMRGYENVVDNLLDLGASITCD